MGAAQKIIEFISKLISWRKNLIFRNWRKAVEPQSWCSGDVALFLKSSERLRKMINCIEREGDSTSLNRILESPVLDIRRGPMAHTKKILSRSVAFFSSKPTSLNSFTGFKGLKESYKNCCFLFFFDNVLLMLLILLVATCNTSMRGKYTEI